MKQYISQQELTSSTSKQSKTLLSRSETPSDFKSVSIVKKTPRGTQNSFNKKTTKSRDVLFKNFYKKERLVRVEGQRPVATSNSPEGQDTTSNDRPTTLDKSRTSNAKRRWSKEPSFKQLMHAYPKEKMDIDNEGPTSQGMVRIRRTHELLRSEDDSYAGTNFSRGPKPLSKNIAVQLHQRSM